MKLLPAAVLIIPILFTKPAISKPLTDLQFVEIPAGEFVMGTTNLEEAVQEMPKPDKDLITDEAPAHRVVFPGAFLLSSTEVTQKVWRKIMETRPGPAEHWQHPQWKRLPVVSVSWHDTQTFISKLNKQSATHTFRLPTEAEWEYAARAGSNNLRPFSHLDMGQYAWYINSSNDEIQPVATLQANPWGLYDMLGNVWEWTHDWYHPTSYANSKTTNPQGPADGSKKVRRGGSYHCPPHLIRPGYRAADVPSKAYSVLGFRLIAQPK